MEAILGHPYSGALYGYFSDQIGGEWSHTRQAGSHGYYRTLYGKNYEAYVELALTFLILYDKIWLTPADNHMPRSKVAPDSRYFIPELELHADWENFRPYRSVERHGYVDKYLEDGTLRHIMKSVLRLPEHCWDMIIESAVYEAGLSARKRCPLLCSPGRRVLIMRLIEIDRPALHPVLSTLHEVRFIESYRSLTGMALCPKSIDDLMDAKPDPIVRKYGSRFLEIAWSESSASDLTTDERVAALMREAMETERISKLFSGALKWAGVFSRLIHLRPVALAATIGSIAANRVGAQAGWHEFSGSIDHAISKAELLRRINKMVAKGQDT
ncbi:MAG: hypothetical protein ACYDDA_15255 [Acidiferrobacteraceae bacterium]